MTSGYARAEAPGEAYAYNDYGIKLYYNTLFDRVFQDDPNQVMIDRLGRLGLQDGDYLYPSRRGHRFASSSRDFARIGWFWLNKGHWDGEQILPSKYFDLYMKPHVNANMPVTTTPGEDSLGIGSYGGPSDQSPHGPGLYGYNWWFNTNQIAFPDAPADMIQANGHWNGEVMVLFPSLGMVIAARAKWGKYVIGDRRSDINQNLRLLSEACDGR